jgi:hypothetical protein
MKLQIRDFILPALISVLLFLAKKEVVHANLYVLFSIAAGLYYFPVSPLLKLKTRKDTDSAEKAMLFVSGFCFSAAVCISAMSLYEGLAGATRILTTVFILQTSSMTVFHFMKDKGTGAFLPWLVFTVIIAEIILV